MARRNQTKALGGGGFLAWRLRRSSRATTSGGGEGMEKWSGECVGQAQGGFKMRLDMPGRPRRVACVLRRAAMGGTTRHRLSELVGHVH